MLRIGILTTHPIQYHGPFFKHLATKDNLQVKVFYAHRATADEQADAGFGVPFDWDLPLLEGYQHQFLRNVAEQPSISRFGGLDTPEIRDVVFSKTLDALVVHGWHYKSAWQAIIAGWKSSVPVLVRSDSHLKTERHALKKVAKWPFYRTFIPRLDACLAVGSWATDYFLGYGADPKRIFVVPHCVDSNRLSEQAWK